MKYLERAAIHIAYDNGMVNRNNSHEIVIGEMLSNAIRTGEDLSAVDNFLSTLSDEDMETLCCGEYGVVKCSESVDRVLNAMFEGE